jgi:pimeloyl-ACP methyl ester carboxylesterase
MRWRRIAIWAVVVVAVLAGSIGIAVYRAVGTFAVAIPESLRGDNPGALVAVERIGKYPGFVAQYLLNSVDLPDPIDVHYGTTLYRVEYRTTNYDGKVVFASGLVALPSGGGLKSVVMYLHGTTAERNTAPSKAEMGEGVLVAAAATGMGHILVAPDYIGLGLSRNVHPYMHAKTTVTTCVDLLHATKALVEHLRGAWPASLYLLGFSQGGHAAFALQKELESMDDGSFAVKASAPIAGPCHLRDVSFPQALTGDSESHAFYLAYLANSYAHIYGQPLESVLTAPYVEKVPVLFDGDHDAGAILAAMPHDPRDLFNPDFLDAYDNAKAHWFLDALAENDVVDWTPHAPVRIYYGDNDVDVLPEEARRTEAAMKQRGANVTAISVGPHAHDASALYAIPRAIHWFTELAEGNQETNSAANR